MEFGFTQGGFALSLVRDAAELRAAQQLRYDVFIAELGGDGSGVDHADRREADHFDEFADHLILRPEGSARVIGVTRLMRADQARAAGGFYTDSEYDLGPLRQAGRGLLELGRSCLHPEYRGSAAMFYLWAGITRYVAAHGTDLLFGVASLKGTEAAALADQLSLLHHRYRAPEGLRPRARVYAPMDIVPEAALDRRAAMIALPALVKSYLRLGGRVGDGAFVDHAFNCTDVCMILDAAAMRSDHRRLRALEAVA